MPPSPPSFHERDPDFDEPGKAVPRRTRIEGFPRFDGADAAPTSGIWENVRFVLSQLAPGPVARLVLRPPSGSLIADLGGIYAMIILTGLSQLLALIRLAGAGLRPAGGLGRDSAVRDAKVGLGKSAGASDPPGSRRVGGVGGVRPREGLGRVSAAREKAGGLRIQIAPPPRASADGLEVGDLALIAATGPLGIVSIALCRSLRQEFGVAEVVLLREGWIGLRRPGSERGYESHPLAEVCELGCGPSSPLLWSLIAGGAGPVAGRKSLSRSLRGWRPFRRPTIRFKARGETVRFGDDLSRDEARYVVSLLRAEMRAPAEGPRHEKGAGGWRTIPWQVRAVVYFGLWTGIGGALLALAELRGLSRPDAAEGLAVILGEGTARGEIPLVRGDGGHIRYRIGDGDGPWGGYSSGGSISVTPGGMSVVEIGGLGELRGRIDELRPVRNGLAFRGDRACWALRLVNLWDLAQAATILAACFWTVRRDPRARPALLAWVGLLLAQCLAWLWLTSGRELVVYTGLVVPILVLVALGRPAVRAYFLPEGETSDVEAGKAWAEAARDLA